MIARRLACAGAIAVAGCGSAQRAARTFPEGVYVVTTSVADHHRARLYGRDWDRPIRWTATFRAGRVTQRQDPFYRDQVHVAFGTYRVVGDRLTIRASKRNPAPPEHWRWSFYGGRLTFAPTAGTTSLGVALSAHPWRRVG